MTTATLPKIQSTRTVETDSTKLPVVVVTGGAGYIGSHVVALLLEAGFTPLIIDDFSTGSRSNLLRVNSKESFMPVFEADFTDEKLWQTISQKYQILAVVHLAAKIDATESLLSPDQYLETNFKKTERLLEILKTINVKNLVFASTAAVYGDCSEYPITEKATLKPLNPYGESKMLAEQVIAKAGEWGLNSVVLRFFNAAGSFPEPKILPKNPHGLLAQLKAVVSGAQSSFVLYGDDYNTADGTCVRDFVSVIDIARAVVESVKLLNSQSNLITIFGLTSTLIFNVGTGQGYSIKQILEAAQKVTGQTIPVEVSSRREHEIPISVADSALLKATLNFDLKYSDLESILRSSLLE